MNLSQFGTVQTFKIVMIATVRRLYEQKKTAPDREAVLDDYVRRWWIWVFAALTENLMQSTLFAFCFAATRNAQACQT